MGNRWTGQESADEKRQHTAAATAASPKTKPKPTKCRRCGVECPSARAAWRHKCAAPHQTTKP